LHLTVYHNFLRRNSNSITNLFDELRNLFGQDLNNIGAIADMKATFDNLEAHFPAGLLTPPNSSPDINELGGTTESSFGSAASMSGSSSPEHEGSQTIPKQVLEDPFMTTLNPLLANGQSISESSPLPSSPVAPRKASPRPAVALEDQYTRYRVTSSLATPPDTHHKYPSMPNRRNVSSKLADARGPALAATGKSELASKKASISRKPSFAPEIVSQKIPVKGITPQKSLAGARTATIAKLEPVTASPSVKLAGRGQTDPKIRKLIMKPVPPSSNRRGPCVNITASDTNRSRRESVQLMTTNDTLTKSSSNVIKTNLSSVDHTPPMASTTVPAAQVSTYKTRLSYTRTQPASRVAEVATARPSSNISYGQPNDRISFESFYKVPIPYLLPVPGHSVPGKLQLPMSNLIVPTADALNRTLRSSSVRNLSRSHSSTTLRSSSSSYQIHTRLSRVSESLEALVVRSAPFSPISSASQSASPVARTGLPVGSKHSTAGNKNLSDIMLSATLPASGITTVENLCPQSPTPPAKNTQDVDLAMRLNLLRMFRLRWTAGDDRLSFNVNAAGALPSGDGSTVDDVRGT
jgi:hypothetical protein